MGNFFDKVNKAYADGIGNNRFQEAIYNMIINPEIGIEQQAQISKVQPKDRETEGEAR